MFKNLKSLFVKENEVKSTDSAPQIAGEEPITEENISAEAVANAEIQHQSHEIDKNIDNDDTDEVDITGEVSEKFMDILLGAINKNNQEGFDYIEFKQSLKSLASMNMDEQTKIQSAFAMAKTMGATKPLLLKTAKYYLGILEKESTKFNAAVSNQIAKQVNSKKEKQKDIELSIDNKLKQIDRLSKEIEQLKVDQHKTTNAIVSSENKVLKTKNDFQSTYALLKMKIHKDIELIEKYTTQVTNK